MSTPVKKSTLKFNPGASSYKPSFNPTASSYKPSFTPTNVISQQSKEETKKEEPKEEIKKEEPKIEETPTIEEKEPKIEEKKQPTPKTEKGKKEKVEQDFSLTLEQRKKRSEECQKFKFKKSHVNIMFIGHVGNKK